jgi:hypothetical protein
MEKGNYTDKMTPPFGAHYLFGQKSGSAGKSWLNPFAPAFLSAWCRFRGMLKWQNQAD